jgi:Tfp pilus assembly protein PilE
MKKTTVLIAQRGASMIEMLGVLALSGIMTYGAIKLYQSVRSRQARAAAAMELSDLAANAKVLFRGRGDYSAISLDYLIKAGALKNTNFPIPNAEMRVQSADLGKSFAIVLTGLGLGDCAYFATAKTDWAVAVKANGFADDAKSYCYELEKNTVEFIVQ